MVGVGLGWVAVGVGLGLGLAWGWLGVGLILGCVWAGLGLGKLGSQKCWCEKKCWSQKKVVFRRKLSPLKNWVMKVGLKTFESPKKCES